MLVSLTSASIARTTLAAYMERYLWLSPSRSAVAAVDAMISTLLFLLGGPFPKSLFEEDDSCLSSEELDVRSIVLFSTFFSLKTMVKRE